MPAGAGEPFLYIIYIERTHSMYTGEQGAGPCTADVAGLGFRSHQRQGISMLARGFRVQALGFRA